MGKKKQKKRDSQINESQFSEGDSSTSFQNSSSRNCSIPHEGLFLVSPVKISGCEIYSKHINFGWKDIVFLHPSVMRQLNIEDLVLIKGEEKTALCVTYPVEKLKKHIIVFPNDECIFKSQELVALQKYKNEVKIAEEISIVFEEKNVDTSQIMKEYILRLLSNQYVYENLVLRWKFFDTEYRCTVRSINCPSVVSETNLDKDIPLFYTASYQTAIKISVFAFYANEQIHFPIGGLEKEIKLLKIHFQKFLSRSTYCGILLLKGPSGTGKSLLLRSILNDLDIFVEHVKWYQLLSISQSEARQVVNDVFQKAVNRSPSIIVIEEFNYLCPSKNNAENIHQNISKVLSQLLKSLNNAKVMLIATSNTAEYDTSILHQSGSLIEEIEFKIPTADERINILQKLLGAYDHELNYEHIRTSAEFAHGFTGKDLLEAVKDAQIIACQRKFSDIFDSSDFLNVIRSRGRHIGSIQYNDLNFCIKVKKKSIVTTSDIKVKKVQWSDIGGMSIVKEKLKQVVEWPLKHSEAFKTFNIAPCRGVLLYGPPGCSKTMIAKALSTECELNFISKNAADLYDKYVGESERAVRELFVLAKAKSPCIIFLDEIDALVTERESSSGSSGVGNRIVTTLLTEMDGIEELHGVFIIAATNRPDMLDDALVRNGRINHFIYVPLPDAATREEILRISMRRRSVSEDFDFKILAEKTEGYSGAEIVNLCNEAAFQVLAENPKSELPVFRFQHFENALKYVLPRTNKEMIDFYENFNRKHCE